MNLKTYKPIKITTKERSKQMIKDDWNDVTGNTSRDEIKGKIEMQDINVLIEYLSLLSKSESYMKEYIQDREREEREKREKSNFYYDDEDLAPVIKSIVKAFSTEKMSDKEEEKMLNDAYIWFNLKNDEELIKKLKYRIDELEYTDNEKSRATTVRAIANLLEFVPSTKKWSEINEAIVDIVSKFDFEDLMLLRQTCGNFYLFHNEEFNKILLKAIPNLSAEQMAYYIEKMDDNGDGNSIEIATARKNRIKQINSDLIQDFGTDFSRSLKGMQKINNLRLLKKRATYEVPWRFYSTDEEENAHKEEDNKKDEEIIENSEYYQQYIEELRKLSPIETVKLLSSSGRYDYKKRFFERESLIIAEKLKQVSKQGALVILESFMIDEEEQNISDLTTSHMLKEFFKENNLIDSNGQIIEQPEEDIATAKRQVEIYNETTEPIRIKCDWIKLKSSYSKETHPLNDESIKEEFFDDYKRARGEIESYLNFAGNLIALDKCKDIQLVNIINRINKTSQNNKGDGKTTEDSQREIIKGYLKRRILSMNPAVASLLEVSENGEFNDYIAAVIDQQMFEKERERGE